MNIEDMYEPTGVVIDGNNFLYRTYHVLKHHADGELTMGFIAYSFINQIRNLLPKLGVLHPIVYIVWDGEGSRDPRLRIYPNYKGNRPPSPGLISDTRAALQEEMVHICPRLSVQLPGVEADDLMYLLVTNGIFRQYIKRWVLCTRDEDLMQGISESVKYYNPYSKKVWTIEDFREKYGFDPHLLVLYKALVGDPADNWPGVAGVGKVTASNLLKQDIPDNEIFESILKKMTLKDAAKTTERLDQFARGIRLCELPLGSSAIPNWLDYLDSIVVEGPSGNWDNLHKRFEINAVDKCCFQVGKTGDLNVTA